MRLRRGALWKRASHRRSSKKGNRKCQAFSTPSSKPREASCAFAVEKDGRFDAIVSGFIADDPDAVHLVAMWVAPELRRSGVSAHDPLNIVDGIEPDVGGHEGQPHVPRVVESVHAHPLASQFRDAADALLGNQFEASGVQPAQHLDRHAGVDRLDVLRREVHREICLTACDPLRLVDAPVSFHVADIGKTLGADQISGNVRACPAIGSIDLPRQADCGRFRRWLCVK